MQFLSEEKFNFKQEKKFKKKIGQFLDDIFKDRKIKIEKGHFLARSAGNGWQEMLDASGGRGRGRNLKDWNVQQFVNVFIDVSPRADGQERLKRAEDIASLQRGRGW